MKHIQYPLFILLIFVGCGSNPKKENWAIIPSNGEEIFTPFDKMVANARQPEHTLGHVYFDFDQAQLTSNAKELLNDMANTINARPGTVVIEGHTDHVNSHSYNQKLSAQRALAVANYLTSAGVWEERLHINYFGESRPTATNWQDEGRALNRRVTLKMFPLGEGMSGQQADNVLKNMTQGQKSETPQLNLFGMPSGNQNTEGMPEGGQSPFGNQ